MSLAPLRTPVTRAISPRSATPDDAQIVNVSPRLDDLTRRRTQVEPPVRHGAAGPWRTGMFSFMVFAVAFAGVIVASMYVPWWAVSLAAACSILAVLVVGGHQLRHDGQITEREFLAVTRVVERLGILGKRGRVEFVSDLERNPTPPAD